MVHTDRAVPFGVVKTPWWGTAPTVYLVGGGPSLIGFDFARLRGRGCVLAVNQAMFEPSLNLDAGVSADHVFVTNNAERLRVFADRFPLYLVLGNEWWKAGLPTIENAIYLRSGGPGELTRGSTSGFAGLAIAKTMTPRARRIVLLGYDYSTFEGKHHYHDAYPWHHKAQDQSWVVWARRYAAIAEECRLAGIEVINASPNSALPYFRKCPLDEVL